MQTGAGGAAAFAVAVTARRGAVSLNNVVNVLDHKDDAAYVAAASGDARLAWRKVGAHQRQIISPLNNIRSPLRALARHQYLHASPSLIILSRALNARNAPLFAPSTLNAHRALRAASKQAQIGGGGGGINACSVAIA